MESAKKLVINIVTWNSARYLPSLFASLDQQTSADFTVTAVDNVSVDGTLAFLEARRADGGMSAVVQETMEEGDVSADVPIETEAGEEVLIEEGIEAVLPTAPPDIGLTVLRNFRNQGFARAHNQAIALALSRWDASLLDERYIMFANPDMEFAPTCIEELIRFMDAHPQVAVCGPKLLRATVASEGDDGRLEAERTNIIDAMGITLTKARRPIDRGAGEEDQGQYDAETEVFGLSGACAVFRASALQQAKLGGEWLDEDFFAYQEDVDLAWRMRLLGYEARVVPSAVLWHYRRSPSQPRGGWLSAWRMRRAKSPYINFNSTRNHGWLLLKNEQIQNVLLHLPWLLPYELAKFLVGFFSLTHLKAEWASLLGIPTMLRKRKELMGRVKTPSEQMRKWFV